MVSSRWAYRISETQHTKAHIDTVMKNARAANKSTKNGGAGERSKHSAQRLEDRGFAMVSPHIPSLALSPGCPPLSQVLAGQQALSSAPQER